MREVSGGTTSPLTYFVTIYMHFLLRKQIPVLTCRPYISCMSPIQFVKIGQGCSTPLSFQPLQNVVAILKKKAGLRLASTTLSLLFCSSSLIL